MWRRNALIGQIKINHFNSKELTDPNGIVWFTLVVQAYVAESTNVFSPNDPFGLFVLNFLVNGHVYAFKDKRNRDAVYNYVMNNIADDRNDEEQEEETVTL